MPPRGETHPSVAPRPIYLNDPEHRRVSLGRPKRRVAGGLDLVTPTVLVVITFAARGAMPGRKAGPVQRLVAGGAPSIGKVLRRAGTDPMTTRVAQFGLTDIIRLRKEKRYS